VTSAPTSSSPARTPITRPPSRSSSSAFMSVTTMAPAAVTLSASHWSNRARCTVYDSGVGASNFSEASSMVVAAPSASSVTSSRATGRS
jgi:hypothetical protein